MDSAVTTLWPARHKFEGTFAIPIHTLVFCIFQYFQFPISVFCTASTAVLVAVAAAVTVAS